MSDRRAMAIIAVVAFSGAGIASLLLRVSVGQSSSVGAVVSNDSGRSETGQANGRSGDLPVSTDRVTLGDGIEMGSDSWSDPMSTKLDPSGGVELDSRPAERVPGAVTEVQTYEEAMAALATILESEAQLARSAMAEDPSVRLRMVSRAEAVELSRSGVLFLSGRSEELGDTGYFPANAAQAELLGELQASALELFWSEVYVDTASERLLDHFRTVIGEPGMLIRPREDGYGMEVVDGAGQVRASHLFHVPGYVL